MMNAHELHIEKPCHQDWNAMNGSEQKRFCGSCSEHVHDLSSMTESQARVVVQKPNVCVRYSTDAQGGVVFKAGRWARAAAVFAMLTGTAQAAGSVQNPGYVNRLVEWVWSFAAEEVVTMGEISAPVHSPDVQPSNTVIPELTTPQLIPMDVPLVQPHTTLGKVSMQMPDAVEGVVEPKVRPRLMGRVSVRMPDAIESSH